MIATMKVAHIPLNLLNVLAFRPFCNRSITVFTSCLSGNERAKSSTTWRVFSNPWPWPV